MFRLFLGLRPPLAVRASLIATMRGVPGARWQSDAQLHLTLRFIGDVTPHVADDIAGILSGMHLHAISGAIAGAGRFERAGATDTIWAGVAPAPPLAALHAKLDSALARLGLAREARRFTPHITLARLARGARQEAAIEAFIVRNAALTSPLFAFPELILFESRLGASGANYQPIATWPLGGESD